MPNIRITKLELQSRGNDVSRMLIPIVTSTQTYGPAWQPKVGSSSYIIGTHDGSPAGSDYLGWTFSTVRSNVRAQYYERWLKSELRGREFWYLERAYLNVSKRDFTTRELKEFFCLHCDPDDAPDETLKESDPVKYEKLVKQSYYKQHPHLHVISAEVPFPKAHLALQIGYKNQVLSSIVSLSDALSQAVQMLRDEVLDAMDEPI